MYNPFARVLSVKIIGLRLLQFFFETLKPNTRRIEAIVKNYVVLILE